MTRTEQLQKKLKTVESKLEKNRPSVMADGWQTQKLAKKSRNWDYYAREKMAIIGQLDACNNEDGNEMCNNCDCWKLTREYCS